LGFDIRIVRAAVRATTGTQDFTVSGFGTPKAALFIYSDGETNGVINTDIRFSMGATDGTRQRMVYTESNDGSAATSIERGAFTNRVFDRGSSTESGAFNSWITDGVRLDITQVSGFQKLLTVVLFTGSDLSARVDDVTFSTQNTLVQYTTMGFEADLLLTFGAGRTFANANDGYGHFSLGAVHNTGSGETQRGIIAAEAGGQASGEPYMRLETDSAGGQVNHATGAITWSADFSNFGSTGFHCHARDGASGGDEIGFLALAFNSTARIYLDTVDSPTTSSLNSNTSPGFDPVFSWSYLTGLEAIDTSATDSTAGVFGVHVYDGTNQYSTVTAREDNAGTTNTESLADDSLVLHFDNGSAMIDADMSFITNGRRLTINSESITTAKKWIELMIGPAMVPYETGKQFLDLSLTTPGTESSGYAGIALSATTSASPDIIHTSSSTTGVIDEIHVFVTNTSAAALDVTFQTATGAGADRTEMKTISVPPKSGIKNVIFGMILSDGYRLEAYAPTTPSSINVFGYVNRLDQSP
jgi:hypothetical protein